MKAHYNIPIFIPELACPHQCVFCNQEKISGAFSVPKPDEIKYIIDEHLNTIPENKHIEIAFFGGSFSGIPIKLQEEYLKSANYYIKNNRVSAIRFSTRPDYINKEVIGLSAKYNVKTIELGAQSTDDSVLKKSRRGHSFEQIKNASKLILKNKIKLGLQMMIGLPGDTFEKSQKTAKDIVALAADNTRIYPTLVIKGTALEKMYIEGKYKPLSIDEAVNWSKDIIRVFEENNVNIIRTGLHPSEELSSEKSLIAGPYHPSFKELVLTEIWYDIIKEKIENISNREFIIKINDKQLNYAVGYKGKNRDYIISKGNKVKFIAEPNLKKYQINVSSN